MKPKIFSPIPGAWQWKCSEDVGNIFYSSQWKDPWSACLSNALNHYAVYHYEPEEYLELD